MSKKTGIGSRSASARAKARALVADEFAVAEQKQSEFALVFSLLEKREQLDSELASVLFRLGELGVSTSVLARTTMLPAAEVKRLLRLVPIVEEESEKVEMLNPEAN